jgi:hypothetical protein
MKAGMIALMLGLGGLPAAAAVPANLCGDGCEYRVNNFSGTYPDERERVHWECFDRSTQDSVPCSQVHGDDIRKYSDVYRKKPVTVISGCFEQCIELQDKPADYCAKVCRKD